LLWTPGKGLIYRTAVGKRRRGCVGPGNPPLQLHREEKELNEATTSAHLGDSQNFTAFPSQTGVTDFFLLFSF